MFCLRKQSAICHAKVCFKSAIRTRTLEHDKIGLKKPKPKKSWLPENRFCNPMHNLQPLVAEPLLDPPEGLFTVTEDKVQKSDELFAPGTGRTWRSFKGAIDHNLLMNLNLPEVAFIGRSNVGKSTLISSLMFHSERVRISGVPGHTTSMKQFMIGKQFTLVDMPGYGHNMPSHFRQSVEEYLENRAQLHRTFVLVDGKVGLTSLDGKALDLMEELSKPYTIVLTKIDQVPASTMIDNIMQVKKMQNSTLECCFPQVFLLSSQADVGVSFLRAFITEITSAAQQHQPICVD